MTGQWSISSNIGWVQIDVKIIFFLNFICQPFFFQWIYYCCITSVRIYIPWSFVILEWEVRTITFIIEFTYLFLIDQMLSEHVVYDRVFLPNRNCEFVHWICDHLQKSSILTGLVSFSCFKILTWFLNIGDTKWGWIRHTHRTVLNSFINWVLRSSSSE